MTEEEWLSAADPTPMLVFLHGKWTERKLRLALVAAVREAWDKIDWPELEHIVDAGECYADGLISEAEFRQAGSDFYLAAREISQQRTARGNSQPHTYPSLRSEEGREFTSRFQAIHAPVVTRRGLQNLQSMNCWLGLHAISRKQVVGAFREVFGNPFRPITFDPRWQTSTVLDLARLIYDERAFDRLPILADALMDAGCDSEDILNHCRSEGPHVRGCWVIDLLLGKN